MLVIYNDGGRAKAGYQGYTGDCVCRAIAIATKQDYEWARAPRPPDNRGHQK